MWRYYGTTSYSGELQFCLFLNIITDGNIWNGKTLCLLSQPNPSVDLFSFKGSLTMGEPLVLSLLLFWLVLLSLFIRNFLILCLCVCVFFLVGFDSHSRSLPNLLALWLDPVSLVVGNFSLDLAFWSGLFADMVFFGVIYDVRLVESFLSQLTQSRVML